MNQLTIDQRQQVSGGYVLMPWLAGLIATICGGDGGAGRVDDRLPLL